jgi:hypothetical protein
MLYNVPKGYFGSCYGDTFVACFNWLNSADQTKLVCANYLHWLLRSSEHTSWDPVNFRKFIDATRTLWNQW